MNFELDDMQTLLKDSVSRYIERSYSFAQRREIIAEGGFSQERWAWFAEMGWLGAGLPEAAGGLGGTAVETAILMEEFGRGLVVDPYLAIAVFAARALLAIDDERARSLVGAIAEGSRRPVLAHSEPASDGAISWIETTAVRDGAGGWSLTGRKSLIWGGPFADSFIVPARTAGTAADEDGISLFLVPADAAGLERLDIRLADNGHASELLIRDLKLPADALLGQEGQGYHALDAAFAHGIVAMSAEAVGAMEHALWTTRDYLKTRHQFGQPIGNFQALQHRMAEMVVELELARSSVYRAIAYLDSDPVRRRHAVSTTKIQIARSGKYIGGQAIQLHGGIGVTEEYEIGHYFKRLTAISNAFGPPEVHLNRLADLAAVLD